MQVDFDPGYVSPRHTHPGEEIIYVIEGSLEYEIGGKSVKVKAGDVLFVPPGTIHSAKNIGSDNGAELATYCRKRKTAHHAGQVSTCHPSKAVRPYKRRSS